MQSRRGEIGANRNLISGYVAPRKVGGSKGARCGMHQGDGKGGLPALRSKDQGNEQQEPEACVL